jgi:hypothetical protein
MRERVQTVVFAYESRLVRPGDARARSHEASRYRERAQVRRGDESPCCLVYEPGSSTRSVSFWERQLTLWKAQALDGAAQLVRRDSGVALRRVEVLVSEQLLDLT